MSANGSFSEQEKAYQQRLQDTGFPVQGQRLTRLEKRMNLPDYIHICEDSLFMAAPAQRYAVTLPMAKLISLW